MEQRLRNWLRSRSRWWTYVLTCVMTLLLLRLLAQIELPFPPGLLLLFLGAVIAHVAGIWPAILSSVLTLLLTAPVVNHLADYLRVPPPHSFELVNPPMFLLVAVVMEVVVDAMHRAHLRSEEHGRRQASILAHISDAIITTVPSGHIEYLNPAAQRLLGVAPGEVIGQLFEAVVDVRDEDQAASRLLTQQVLQAGVTVQTGPRQILLRADGARVPVETVVAPVMGADGVLTNAVITLRDCTERRRTDDVLRERLEIQRQMERISSVVPGVLMTIQFMRDDASRLIYASALFKEILGVDPQFSEPRYGMLFDMVHPDDRARVQQAMVSCLQELKPVELEHRMLTPHRGLRWIAISANISIEPDGSRLWHGILIDVTERKLAEARLHMSQMQLQAALQAGGMGVIEVDLSDGTVQLDATGRRLWDLPATDGKVDIALLRSKFHPEATWQGWPECQQELIAGQQLECHLLLEDNEERWLLLRGGAYQDTITGRMVKVAVVMDNTHNRRVEAQRLHSQKLEALGVLAAGIAHDFNNLLLAISGNARLLLHDLRDGDPGKVSAREIEVAAMRAADLVRRILSFSSTQDVRRPVYPLSLRPVLDEVLELAQTLLPARLNIVCKIHEPLPDIRAESGQVHQVLINLLTNAADAVRSGAARGRIEVVAEAITAGAAESPGEATLSPGRYVRITVSDNGLGIAPADVQRIFDPFFTTKPSGRGTGLGLAVVHGIMKQLNGAVTALSNPGEGASFSVYFPISDTAAAATEPVSDAVPAGKPAHILYVDDEESLVFLMTRTLERMGHRVTACLSPLQALEIFSQSAHDFDLVVSDMAMPGMSGLELAEKMLAVRPQLPFVITSGYVDADTVERARVLGVRNMIMKPNTVDELSGILMVILQEQTTSPG